MTMPITEVARSADSGPPIAPARSIDRFRAAIQALVSAGTLQAWHSDKEVQGAVAAYIKAHGGKVPASITFKRHLPRLRPLWRMQK